MKKIFSGGIAVLVVLIILVVAAFSYFKASYNSMVSMEEEVRGQWGQVENVYQRRFDLIPNLVETVKGYASHESEVFTQVAEARSKAGGVMQISDEILQDPGAFERFQKAQGELSSALQRLLSVSESYPELKANENFLALQDQLEGTENRIAVERQRFNDAVKVFNVYVRQFPRSIVASIGGFREKSYFAADAAAQTAPKVSF